LSTYTLRADTSPKQPRGHGPGTLYKVEANTLEEAKQRVREREGLKGVVLKLAYANINGASE